MFDRSQLPQHLRRHRGGRQYGHLGNVRHEAECGGPCARGMYQTRRQELRGPSVDLLFSGRERRLLAPQRAGSAERGLLGRHRLQHRRYGGGMVARQGRSRERGKGSDGRLCATRQGVRVADHFQQAVRGARRGPRFRGLGELRRTSGKRSKRRSTIARRPAAQGACCTSLFARCDASANGSWRGLSLTARPRSNLRPGWSSLRRCN